MRAVFARFGVLLGIVVALGVAIWFFASGTFGSIFPKLGSLFNNALPAPPLTQEYRNDTYGFSLMMPEDFTVQEFEEDENGKTAIALQNDKGHGVQILITPYLEDLKNLTAQDVLLAVPDMLVDDPEELEIGDQYTGVAFKSDNKEFGGDSREVWFYFRGNIYQISTYAYLDNYLKAMFGTWKFF